MKRAALTLFLLTLAASVAGTATPSEAPQQASSLEIRVTPDSSGAPQAAPSGEVGSVLLGGWASWYDDPRKTGLYAAAGPLLREALGDWRGKVIRVTSGNRATLVVLSDFCQCGERHGIPTIVDLSPEAFADLAPLAQGLVRVEIEIVALPATDAEAVQ